MGEPQNPHFYDFGILGHVPEPQNQLFLIFGHTKIPKQKIERIPGTLKKHCFHTSQNCGDPFLKVMEKTGVKK